MITPPLLELTAFFSFPLKLITTLNLSLEAPTRLIKIFSPFLTETVVYFELLAAMSKSITFVALGSIVK